MSISVFEEIIKCAVLAPSGHNTQPWQFIIDKNAIHICPDFNRSCPVSDPDHHILFISLGCALENLVIAANQFGYQTMISFARSKVGNVYLKVGLKKVLVTEKNSLFPYLSKRQVNRGVYAAKEIPASDLELLRRTYTEKGVTFQIMSDESDRAALMPLVLDGFRRQKKNKAQLREAIKWLRFSKKDAERSGDGLWSATLGLPALPSFLGKLLVRLVASRKSELEHVKKLIEGSSSLVIFMVDTWDIKHWVTLGRVFQRFCLTCTKLGIAHSHLHAPCEYPESRHLIQKQFCEDRGSPRILLRLGYAPNMPYSFRRATEQVIINKTDLDFTEHRLATG
jgi:hypothetical protein